MKRILLVLVALCLFLSACSRRPDHSSPSSSQESPSSDSSKPTEPTQLPQDPSSGPDESGSSSEPGEEGLDFYEEVMLNYGGVVSPLETGGEVMLVDSVSLYYTDDWDGAASIPAGNFYSWYLSSTSREGLSDQELREKYKSPLEGDEGWFFPQDLYESKIRQYFDVSTEHLRSERLIYDPELEGYYLQGGGGIGDKYTLTLDDVTDNGDSVTLRVCIRSFTNPDAAPEYKLLAIRRAGDGYQYISCKTE